VIGRHGRSTSSKPNVLATMGFRRWERGWRIGDP
jgi:hypothetical protein